MVFRCEWGVLSSFCSLEVPVFYLQYVWMCVLGFPGLPGAPGLQGPHGECDVGPQGPGCARWACWNSADHLEGSWLDFTGFGAPDVGDMFVMHRCLIVPALQFSSRLVQIFSLIQTLKTHLNETFSDNCCCLSMKSARVTQRYLEPGSRMFSDAFLLSSLSFCIKTERKKPFIFK